MWWCAKSTPGGASCIFCLSLATTIVASLAHCLCTLACLCLAQMQRSSACTFAQMKQECLLLLLLRTASPISHELVSVHMLLHVFVYTACVHHSSTSKVSQRAAKALPCCAAKQQAHSNQQHHTGKQSDAPKQRGVTNASYKACLTSCTSAC